MWLSNINWTCLLLLSAAQVSEIQGFGIGQCLLSDYREIVKKLRYLIPQPDYINNLCEVVRLITSSFIIDAVGIFALL